MSWDGMLTWLSGFFAGFGVGWLVGRMLAFRWFRSEVEGVRQWFNRRER